MIGSDFIMPNQSFFFLYSAGTIFWEPPFSFLFMPAVQSSEKSSQSLDPPTFYYPQASYAPCMEHDFLSLVSRTLLPK